jgi:hypothetical protein
MFDVAGLTAAPRAAPLARTVDRARARARLLLAGVAACYVGVIVLRPLVAPDEFRYAEVPREMLASGDPQIRLPAGPSPRVRAPSST